jgi:hypothetical protein
MDFAERQKAVAIAAVFDEGCLQTRFYANDFGEIDVALELAFGRCLDIEILQPITIQHHHAGFLRVRCVDQHTLRHIELNSEQPLGGAVRIPDECVPAGGKIGVSKWAGPSAQGSEHSPAEHSASMSSRAETWG